MGSAGDYTAAYARSVHDPVAFWGEAAQLVDWVEPPTTVVDDSNPPFYRWFSDGRLNTCFNAVDRHVEAGHGDRTALIYDSAVAEGSRSLTYRELRDEVALFAGVLASLGVSAGDRVIIYMPMVPEALIAMLATARLGAVHSVVFGGFAPNELAIRIDDATPTVVVSASCGIEGARVIEYKPMLDKALELAEHKPTATVILQRPQVHADMGFIDHDWVESMSAATPHDCVAVAATDPLYILYTSGTTGKPKGIVRDNGGHAVALTWSMPNIYGVNAGEVFWAASDVGWVVGHSYIVYAPLLAGATTVLYEARRYPRCWRVLACCCRAQGQCALHCANGISGHQERGSQCRTPCWARHLIAEDTLLSGGAPRSRDLPLGKPAPEHSDRRQLVADRNWVADRGQPTWL